MSEQEFLNIFREENKVDAVKFMKVRLIVFLKACNLSFHLNFQISFHILNPLRARLAS